MKRHLGQLRKNYNVKTLTEDKAPDSPLELFTQWFDEVSIAGGVDEVNAMTLSTVDVNGIVRARVVLLKDLLNENFVFYTNYNSDKSKAMFAKSNVSLSFFWPNLERQVLISGVAQKTDASTSDAYFASRPRGSQLGAHVSPQSEPIDSREFLEKKLEILNHKFEGKSIPRPKYWGGIAVLPERIEFWQGRPNRLHDRIVYTKGENNSWIRQRLAP